MKEVIEFIKKSIQGNTANTILLLGILAVSVIGTLGYQYYAPAEVLTQAGVLSYYGYTTIEQIGALEYLLKQAGIIKDQGSLNDLFPKRNDKQDMLSDVLNFVKLTQSHFVLRSGVQERWEVNPAAWMRDAEADEVKKQATLDAFGVLGFLDKIEPAVKTVDAICILGSTMKTMSLRLADADKLLREKKINAKHVILLAGERSVLTMKDGKLSINTPDDGNEKQLLALANEYEISVEKITETHLIRKAYQLYQESTSSPLAKLTVHVIDTPAGSLPRPTTETTVIELVRQLAENEAMSGIKTIAFVSNQPHIKYQEAVIKEVLDQQRSDLKCEVIGPMASNNIDIKAAAGACGSHIFASTPFVLNALGVSKINDEKLKQEFLDLYKQNPLIYKHVQKL